MDLTYTQGTAPANEDRPFIMSLFPNIRQLTIRAVPGLISNTPLAGSSLHGSEEDIVQEPNFVACHSPQIHQVPSIRLDGDLWRAFTPLDIERIEFFGIQVLTRCADIVRIFETRSGFNNLHTLRLTCFNAEETLTLKTLAVFSSKLPQLTTLSLYVDLDGHDEDEVQLEIDESESSSAWAEKSFHQQR
ncbi:hypothetical protein BJ165DRAFT_129303 [Panaeolus papilionaceus]|nr:hypothetical protein BJ165DRAFT_129303 [Panaeolus papilionaceus]